jgi:hypothetical protein
LVTPDTKEPRFWPGFFFVVLLKNVLFFVSLLKNVFLEAFADLSFCGFNVRFLAFLE